MPKNIIKQLRHEMRILKLKIGDPEFVVRRCETLLSRLEEALEPNVETKAPVQKDYPLLTK